MFFRNRPGLHESDFLTSRARDSETVYYTSSGVETSNLSHAALNRPHQTLKFYGLGLVLGLRLRSSKILWLAESADVNPEPDTSKKNSGTTYPDANPRQIPQILPRGSIYTTIMELGPQYDNKDAPLGPNSPSHTSICDPRKVSGFGAEDTSSQPV